MDDKDRVEIELEKPIIDKTVDEDVIVVQKSNENLDENVRSKNIDPEDGISDLKNKLQQEQRLRYEAEIRARDAVQNQYRAQNETEHANFALVEGAIRTLTEEKEHIKFQYKEALAVGDYDRVADLQEAIADNKLNLSELQKGHRRMQAEREHARQVPPPPPVPSNPVEALASTLSERSGDWVRRNPEYAKDRRLFQKMVAAHQMVIADGVEPDTDEYFDAIETTLKMRGQQRREERVEEDEMMSEASKPTQKRVAPPAAPVSRSGTPGNTRSNGIRLTREEIDAASDSGLTPLQYYENKQALKNEGRIGGRGHE